MHNFFISTCKNIYIISSDQLPASKGSFRIKEISKSAQQIYELFSSEKFINTENSRPCLHFAPFTTTALENSIKINKNEAPTMIHISGAMVLKNNHIHLPFYTPKQTGFTAGIELEYLLNNIISNTSQSCVILDTLYFDEKAQICPADDAKTVIDLLLNKFSETNFIVNSTENTTNAFVHQNYSTTLTSALIQVTESYNDATEELTMKNWFQKSIEVLINEKQYHLPLLQLNENILAVEKKNLAPTQDVLAFDTINEKLKLSLAGTSIKNFETVKTFSEQKKLDSLDNGNMNLLSENNDMYQHLLNNVIEEERTKLEVAFWNKIQHWNVPSAYMFYLEFFENGKYVQEAEELLKKNIKLKDQHVLDKDNEILHVTYKNFIHDREEEQQLWDSFAEKVGETYQQLENQKRSMMEELDKKKKAIEQEKEDLDNYKKDLLEFQKQLKEKDIVINNLENKLKSQIQSPNTSEKSSVREQELKAKVEELTYKIDSLILDLEQKNNQHEEIIFKSRKEKELLISSHELEKKQLIEQIDQNENTINLLNIIQEQLAERMVKNEKSLNTEKFAQKDKDLCINKLRSENQSLKDQLLIANKKCSNLEERNSESLNKHKELLAEVVSLKAQLNNIQINPIEKQETISEDQLWEKTLSTGTEEAYQKYINDTSEGTYISEAEMHMATLKMINQTMKKASSNTGE